MSRTTTLACSRCPAALPIEQTATDGAWTPDAHVTATAAGWARIGGAGWLCPGCTNQAQPTEGA